jgi:Ion transport protein
LENINYVFTAIFALEVIIKLIGQGFKPYFSDGWNTFDCLVAVASGLSIIVSAHTSLSIKGALTLLRTFRILRILRLLKRGGRNLHMIFNTFVITISQLVNIGALLLLIIYMYSVLGMMLFGANMRSGLMNHYINFENFIHSFLTLFTVTTGDSWNATQTSFVVE